ncbi:adenosylcobalamin-dependent ribonucleoside-diphosphate reductase [bacterium]|nr:adenosylcobalamin-dependent ribonucleoside-diphosphate reductase [bacterium]
MSTENIPDIQWQIWDMKYRYRAEDGTPLDATVEDTWRRVARGLAIYERDRERWEKHFYDCLADYRFLPGGRIVANAGTARKRVTMFNCYVLNRIDDSIEGIFETVRNAALTQKQGGGVGFDFSTIRPKGAFIRGVHASASGPVSYMRVFDATCRTIMSAGQRRGAQMAVLSVRHPDVEEFIMAKRDGKSLQMFNLSVAITNEFVEAVKADGRWDLTFDHKVYKTVRARDLWEKIMRSTYDYAEPGFILIDRINELNNMYYCEDIRATNPCGEQPLPPFGACLLGSVNLTRFVSHPFTSKAAVEYKAIEQTVAVAVRMLDNTIDISNYPLEQQRDQAMQKRRMGIGVTGLADALVFLGMRYGSPESIETAGNIMRTITHSAYRASIELAKEKGPFQHLDREKHVRGAFVSRLPEDIRDGILKHGIRNSHLTSVAPTGTISLYAGNVSSGLEPIFALSYTRRVRTGYGDEMTEQEVVDYAYRRYREQFPDHDPKRLPPSFVTTDDISPHEHVDMQAALQHHVDSSISKTVNVPRDFPFEEFQEIYMYAYEKGLKGCTTFRPSDAIAGVLVRKEEEKKQPLAEAEDPEQVVGRPIELHGVTYKIKTPLSAQALYITINDIIEPDNVRRPFEIFINSKNLQHFSWMVAMTRLISAVFRRTRNPSFLVEELKCIFDPNGGYFKNGRYVPSLVAEIGEVIEHHLETLGIAGDEEAAAVAAQRASEPATAGTPT